MQAQRIIKRGKYETSKLGIRTHNIGVASHTHADVLQLGHDARDNILLFSGNT